MNSTNDSGVGFVLSQSTYNLFKTLVQLVLPAFGTLYFSLAALWGLPASEQVVGTTAAVATFFGVVLGISSKNYNAGSSGYDGTMTVTFDSDNTVRYSLALESDPIGIADKDVIRFKVATEGRN